MSERVINLTFHGTGESPHAISDDERDVWMSEQSFGDVLDAVRDGDDVRLTFDDGNESDLTIALPALLERGMRAEFFVCAGRIGRRHYLDAGQLRELSAAGMSIGLHGMDHVAWRDLSPTRLQREINEARTIIEDAIGEQVVHAACPYGAYDRRSLNALRTAGFERVYTSDRGAAVRDAWLQPRNTVGRDDGSETIEALLARRFARRTLVQNVKGLLKQWR